MAISPIVQRTTDAPNCHGRVHNPVLASPRPTSVMPTGSDTCREVDCSQRSVNGWPTTISTPLIAMA